MQSSLVAGLAIGLAGLLGAVLLFAVFWIVGTLFRLSSSPADAMGRANVELALAVGFGAFLTGGIGWWLAAAEQPGPVRGLLVGTAAGLSAHPICWFVTLLLDGRGWRDLLVLPLPMGAFSLIIVGWMTVPPPALAGWALGLGLERRMRRAIEPS